MSEAAKPCSSICWTAASSATYKWLIAVVHLPCSRSQVVMIWVLYDDSEGIAIACCLWLVEAINMEGYKCFGCFSLTKGMWNDELNKASTRISWKSLWGLFLLLFCPPIRIGLNNSEWTVELFSKTKLWVILRGKNVDQGGPIMRSCAACRGACLCRGSRSWESMLVQYGIWAFLVAGWASQENKSLAFSFRSNNSQMKTREFRTFSIKNSEKWAICILSYTSAL